MHTKKSALTSTLRFCDKKKLGNVLVYEILMDFVIKTHTTTYAVGIQDFQTECLQMLCIVVVKSSGPDPGTQGSNPSVVTLMFNIFLMRWEFNEAPEKTKAEFFTTKEDSNRGNIYQKLRHKPHF